MACDFALPLNMALVERHRLVRAGLEMILRQMEELATLISVESVGELYARLRGSADRLDVALVDYVCVLRDSAGLLKDLRDRQVARSVVCIARPGVATARTLIKLGVDAIASVDGRPEDLMAVIRGVRTGRTAWPRGVRCAIPGSERGRTILTLREEEVARLLAEGASNQEIAKELCLSVRTVGNYVSVIYGKLGTTCRFRIGVRLVELDLL